MSKIIRLSSIKIKYFLCDAYTDPISDPIYARWEHVLKQRRVFVVMINISVHMV